jgi:F-type H+-transporting ATPase subunit b
MKKRLFRAVATLAAVIALAGVSRATFAQPEEDLSHPGAIKSGEVPNTTTAKEQAEENEEGGPLPINWVDFGNKKQIPYSVYLLNFGILIYVYVSFGKKPVREALKERRDSIAKDIEEAQKMKKEAKQRAKKYQAKLEGLDAELVGAKQALIDAGKADKDRIVREAQEKAARMERDAKSLLEQESRQVHEDLVKETVEAAVREAEELLKQRVLPEDHERLAEDFLAQLGRRGGPSLAPPAAPTAPAEGSSS